MPKEEKTLHSFNAGELTPLLSTASNLEYYPRGCSKLENVVVWKHGGIIKRSGSKFICNLEDE